MDIAQRFLTDQPHFFQEDVKLKSEKVWTKPMYPAVFDLFNILDGGGGFLPSGTVNGRLNDGVSVEL